MRRALADLDGRRLAGAVARCSEAQIEAELDLLECEQEDGDGSTFGVARLAQSVELRGIMALQALAALADPQRIIVGLSGR